MTRFICGVSAAFVVLNLFMAYIGWDIEGGGPFWPHLTQSLIITSVALVLVGLGIYAMSGLP